VGTASLIRRASSSLTLTYRGLERVADVDIAPGPVADERARDSRHRSNLPHEMVGKAWI
jgi:hypothetical protein